MANNNNVINAGQHIDQNPQINDQELFNLKSTTETNLINLQQQLIHLEAQYTELRSSYSQKYKNGALFTTTEQRQQYKQATETVQNAYLSLFRELNLIHNKAKSYFDKGGSNEERLTELHNIVDTAHQTVKNMTQSINTHIEAQQNSANKEDDLIQDAKNFREDTLSSKLNNTIKPLGERLQKNISEYTVAKEQELASNSDNKLEAEAGREHFEIKENALNQNPAENNGIFLAKLFGLQNIAKQQAKANDNGGIALYEFERNPSYKQWKGDENNNAYAVPKAASRMFEAIKQQSNNLRTEVENAVNNINIKKASYNQWNENINLYQQIHKDAGDLINRYKQAINNANGDNAKNALAEKFCNSIKDLLFDPTTTQAKVFNLNGNATNDIQTYTIKIAGNDVKVPCIVHESPLLNTLYRTFTTNNFKAFDNDFGIGQISDNANIYTDYKNGHAETLAWLEELEKAHAKDLTACRDDKTAIQIMHSTRDLNTTRKILGEASGDNAGQYKLNNAWYKAYQTIVKEGTEHGKWQKATLKLKDEEEEKNVYIRNRAVLNPDGTVKGVESTIHYGGTLNPQWLSNKKLEKINVETVENIAGIPKDIADNLNTTEVGTIHTVDGKIELAAKGITARIKDSFIPRDGQAKMLEQMINAEQPIHVNTATTGSGKTEIVTHHFGDNVIRVGATADGVNAMVNSTNKALGRDGANAVKSTDFSIIPNTSNFANEVGDLVNTEKKYRGRVKNARTALQNMKTATDTTLMNNPFGNSQDPRWTQLNGLFEQFKTATNNAMGEFATQEGKFETNPHGMQQANEVEQQARNALVRTQAVSDAKQAILDNIQVERDNVNSVATLNNHEGNLLTHADNVVFTLYSHRDTVAVNNNSSHNYYNESNDDYRNKGGNNTPIPQATRDWLTNNKDLLTGVINDNGFASGMLTGGTDIDTIKNDAITALNSIAADQTNVDFTKPENKLLFTIADRMVFMEHLNNPSQYEDAAQQLINGLPNINILNPEQKSDFLKKTAQLVGYDYTAGQENSAFDKTTQDLVGGMPDYTYKNFGVNGVDQICLKNDNGTLQPNASAELTEVINTCNTRRPYGGNAGISNHSIAKKYSPELAALDTLMTLHKERQKQAAQEAQNLQGLEDEFTEKTQDAEGTLGVLQQSATQTRNAAQGVEGKENTERKNYAQLRVDCQVAGDIQGSDPFISNSSALDRIQSLMNRAEIQHEDKVQDIITYLESDDTIMYPNTEARLSAAKQLQTMLGKKLVIDEFDQLFSETPKLQRVNANGDVITCDLKENGAPDANGNQLYDVWYQEQNIGTVTLNANNEWFAGTINDGDYSAYTADTVLNKTEQQAKFAEILSLYKNNGGHVHLLSATGKGTMEDLQNLQDENGDKLGLVTANDIDTVDYSKIARRLDGAGLDTQEKQKVTTSKKPSLPLDTGSAFKPQNLKWEQVIDATGEATFTKRIGEDLHFTGEDAEVIKNYYDQEALKQALNQPTTEEIFDALTALGDEYGLPMSYGEIFTPKLAHKMAVQPAKVLHVLDKSKTAEELQRALNVQAVNRLNTKLDLGTLDKNAIKVDDEGNLAAFTAIMNNKVAGDEEEIQHKAYRSMWQKGASLTLKDTNDKLIDSGVFYDIVGQNLLNYNGQDLTLTGIGNALTDYVAQHNGKKIGNLKYQTESRQALMYQIVQNINNRDSVLKKAILLAQNSTNDAVKNAADRITTIAQQLQGNAQVTDNVTALTALQLGNAFKQLDSQIRIEAEKDKAASNNLQNNWVRYHTQGKELYEQYTKKVDNIWRGAHNQIEELKNSVDYTNPVNVAGINVQIANIITNAKTAADTARTQLKQDVANILKQTSRDINFAPDHHWVKKFIKSVEKTENIQKWKDIQDNLENKLKNKPDYAATPLIPMYIEERNFAAQDYLNKLKEVWNSLTPGQKNIVENAAQPKAYAELFNSIANIIENPATNETHTKVIQCLQGRMDPKAFIYKWNKEFPNKLITAEQTNAINTAFNNAALMVLESKRDILLENKAEAGQPANWQKKKKVTIKAKDIGIMPNPSTGYVGRLDMAVKYDEGLPAFVTTEKPLAGLNSPFITNVTGNGAKFSQEQITQYNGRGGRNQDGQGVTQSKTIVESIEQIYKYR